MTAITKQNPNSLSPVTHSPPLQSEADYQRASTGAPNMPIAGETGAAAKAQASGDAPMAGVPGPSPQRQEPGATPQLEEPSVASQPEEPGVASQLTEPSAAQQLEEAGATSQLAEPSAAQQLEEPGAVPQAAEPGAAPQPEEPGARPRLAENGAAPHVAETSATPQLNEPDAASKAEEPSTTPQAAEPGAAPQAGEPGAAPQLEEPGAAPLPGYPNLVPSIPGAAPVRGEPGAAPVTSTIYGIPSDPGAAPQLEEPGAAPQTGFFGPSDPGAAPGKGEPGAAPRSSRNEPGAAPSKNLPGSAPAGARIEEKNGKPVLIPADPGFGGAPPTPAATPSFPGIFLDGRNKPRIAVIDQQFDKHSGHGNVVVDTLKTQLGDGNNHISEYPNYNPDGFFSEVLKKTKESGQNYDYVNVSGKSETLRYGSTGEKILEDMSNGSLHGKGPREVLLSGSDEEKQALRSALINISETNPDQLKSKYFPNGFDTSNDYRSDDSRKGFELLFTHGNTLSDGLELMDSGTNIFHGAGNSKRDLADIMELLSIGDERKYGETGKHILVAGLGREHSIHQHDRYYSREEVEANPKLGMSGLTDSADIFAPASTKEHEIGHATWGTSFATPEAIVSDIFSRAGVKQPKFTPSQLIELISSNDN